MRSNFWDGFDFHDSGQKGPRDIIKKSASGMHVAPQIISSNLYEVEGWEKGGRLIMSHKKVNTAIILKKYIL